MTTTTLAPAVTALPSRPRLLRLPGGDWSRSRRYLSPLVLVLLWQGASSAGLVSDHTLASPAQIAGTFWGLLASGELPWHLAVSLGRVVSGGTSTARFLRSEPE